VTDATDPSGTTSDFGQLAEPSLSEPLATDQPVAQARPASAPSLEAALAEFDSVFPGPAEPPVPQEPHSPGSPAEDELWTVPQRPLRSRPPPKPQQLAQVQPQPLAELPEPAPAPASEEDRGTLPDPQAMNWAGEGEVPPSDGEPTVELPAPDPTAEIPAAALAASAAIATPSPEDTAAPTLPEDEPTVEMPAPAPTPEAAEARPEPSFEKAPPPIPEPARDTMELAFSASLRRRSPLRFVVWAASVVGAFGLGMVVNDAAERSNTPAVSAAPVASPQPPPPASTSARRLPEAPAPGSDLGIPLGTRPIDDLSKLDPGKRTRLEAVALGRSWSKQHFAELERIGRDLEKNPGGLDDPNVREKMREFVRDRVTSRAALERLAELGSRQSLDMLYEVWTGSKDRTETTQLAEALLLAKDVRPRASPALEVALALRDKPTDCAPIRELVERALRDADRRSAMLLVATGARKNCGEQGDGNCRKCLPDAEHLRKAIQAAAARPEPLQ
jgi:hypothetical protein